jgi:hypothetical protein
MGKMFKYHFIACFGLEENSPSALREIRQNIFRVFCEFLKRRIDASRKHHNFVSKKAE